jgi:DNA-binding transcriptional ArsR family regulator
MPGEPISPAEAFKALGDPIRWSIIWQVAESEELAASVLEDTLPVSKPTISYHTKILAQAGLINVHKRGRNYFYRLQTEAFEELLGALDDLLAAGPLAEGKQSPSSRRRRRVAEQSRVERLRPTASGETTQPTVSLLTW